METDRRHLELLAILFFGSVLILNWVGLWPAAARAIGKALVRLLSASAHRGVWAVLLSPSACLPDFKSNGSVYFGYGEVGTTSVGSVAARMTNASSIRYSFMVPRFEADAS